MWISRVRVTGGFLGGVDVSFERGLNVVIGGRGAGKTTFLELLRHALGIDHTTQRKTRQRDAFIKAVLGEGEVVLDLEDAHGESRIVVDAEGRGRSRDLVNAALMLGQNELESIASDSDARLKLIDLRASVTSYDRAKNPLITELTVEMHDIRMKLQDLRELDAQRKILKADHDELKQREHEMMAMASERLNAQRDRLSRIEDELLTVMQQEHETITTQQAIEEARAANSAALSTGKKLFASGRSSLSMELILPEMSANLSSLEFAAQNFVVIANTLASRVETLRDAERSLRSSAEPVRASLEEAEAGLGEITARLRDVNAELARLAAVRAQMEDLRDRYDFLKHERDRLAEIDENEAEELFSLRRSTAERLSGEVSERVIVSVEHLADGRRFRTLLEELLNGAGVQFRGLAEIISQAMLPAQLIEIVEQSASSDLAAVLGISEQRGARIIGRLDERESLERLAGIQLDDSVDFLLRDGLTLKGVEELSTGQKCAVTLPILLTEHKRILILDQPEDHLDNAFLVKSVVSGLVSRSRGAAQTIIATHNANIPVLGAADRVIAMRSDGARGRVIAEGGYDQPALVREISSVMEGGREAFGRRAAFYREHGISHG